MVASTWFGSAHEKEKVTGSNQHLNGVEEAFHDRIHHFLTVHLHENAIFLAEQLVAQNESEKNIYVLATCYYRAGRVNQAISVLSHPTQFANRYLLAVCCFHQNKLVEAENALCEEGGVASKKNDMSVLVKQSHGAEALYLLGRICRRTNRRELAIDYLSKALEMDSTLWCAYEELCELGANIEATPIFRYTTLPTASSSSLFDSKDGYEDPQEDNNNEEQQSSSPLTPRTIRTPNEKCSNDLFRTPQIRTTLSFTPTPAPKQSCTPMPSQLNHTEKTNQNTPDATFQTPMIARVQTSTTPCFNSPFPHDAVKKPRVASCQAPPNPRVHKTYRRPLIETGERHRRNARLSFSSNVTEDSPHEFTKIEIPDHSTSADPARIHKGRQELLALLSAYGHIQYKLSRYECRDALALLHQLPPKQRASGWAQHQIGRAHFELADYSRAQDVFQALHRTQPHRMGGLDIYSTTLWHLKEETELSYLAQQVTDFDKLSPEAWCVAGNCFSLQKEHDTALVFFQRALQLDPYFTYAYTLSGHEYVSNEDFEKAIGCYRHAIRVDPRHYNAYYGLGTIYYRQEKFDFAEYHFRKALDINPRSSLLYCFLGMVLHSKGQFEEALESLEFATELQPLNPQARFQRANVLITLHRLEEALEELEIVRNFAPRESSVHFLMGKVAKRLGQSQEAMRCFTTALYFHPKDNNVIKSAIDKIHEPDLEDDDGL